MNKEETILTKLGKSLESTIPNFLILKDSAEAIINQTITPEIESKMTPEQSEILNGARNAYNLNGAGLEEKLEELTKLMKKCQQL